MPSMHLPKDFCICCSLCLECSSSRYYFDLILHFIKICICQDPSRKQNPPLTIIWRDICKGTFTAYVGVKRKATAIQALIRNRKKLLPCLRHKEQEEERMSLQHSERAPWERGSLAGAVHTGGSAKGVKQKYPNPAFSSLSLQSQTGAKPCWTLVAEKCSWTEQDLKEGGGWELVGKWRKIRQGPYSKGHVLRKIFTVQHTLFLQSIPLLQLSSPDMMLC